MNDKQLEKVRKVLNDTVIQELDALDVAALQKTVADAEEAVAVATKERNENPSYQTAKLAVSDLSLSLKDVKKYQNAKKHYALFRIREIRG